MPQVIKYRILAKAFYKLGFEIIRQKGSHQRWKHLDGRKTTIPNHKEIAFGTFSGICEQAKLPTNEVLKLLKNV